MTRTVVVVGAGIVGLATARALSRADPTATVLVLEKEDGPARHQTGRNSGVIHSGIYYPPGSAKAVMCRSGARSMTAFAEQHGIEVGHTGKLIVATRGDELAGLERLAERGAANGIAVQRLDPEQARRYEPFVQCLAALRVADTATVDYRAVCDALAGDLVSAGGEIRYGVRVRRIVQNSARAIVETDAGAVEARLVVNCAGLYSDRLAVHDSTTGAVTGPEAADDAEVRIVPFRGEYYQLRPERAYLVKGLIYPVPDADFPFLGVHLTRMFDGSVHAGPNAVLALAREGYRWTTVRPGELADTLRFGGFWRLVRRHGRAGVAEMVRSVSKARFAASLARMVPELTREDLIPAEAGVRAQAVRADGSLVDDFLIRRRGRAVHVVNAPSPAATCALEIGAHIAALAAGGAGG